MKKILVTGSSGFIGTNLINKLLEDKNIIVAGIDINPPKIDTHKAIWTKIDIRDKNKLSAEIRKFNPNYVIHLAARTDLNGKTLEDYDSNITGVSNLIEGLEQQELLEKVIFASSMYVCVPGYQPENFEDYKPHTIYGESKVLTEKIIKSAQLNFTWTILRPTSIWGPWFGEPYKKFFDIVLAGKYFHMGSKACNKTYGYVDNTIFQILTLLDSPKEKTHEKVFYIGDYPAYNISEWADEIANFSKIEIIKIPFLIFRFTAWLGDLLKIIGIKFPMTSFRLKNMTTNNVHNLDLIMELTPKLPSTRKEGIEKTINWIKKTKI